MSRRTGLELGLAAVTEPNTGDIAVKLKAKRSRGVDEVIAEVRAKVRKTEPGLDIEFIQVLQDMIGDLTGAPEPVVVKLFSPDAELLATWAPQVADALAKVKIGGATPIVDVEDGIEKTTSGPAVRFTVNPDAADRAGFTPEELGTIGVAMVEGEPTLAPALINDRPYPLRVRFPPSARASLEAMSNTLLVSSTGTTATLGSLTAVDELPGQTEVRRENLQRLVEVTARLEGVDMGTGIAAVQKTVADLKLPPAIRVEYGGTYREQQKSFRDLTTVLVLAIVLIFLGTSVRVPILHAAGGDPVVGDSLDIGRVLRAAHHPDDVQPVVVHGAHHGGRNRRQEWHPAARCERAVPGNRILARRSGHSGGTAALAADRHDRDGGGGGNAAAGSGAWRRVADAAAVGHCRHRRDPDLDAAVVDCDAGDSVLSDEAFINVRLKPDATTASTLRQIPVRPAPRLPRARSTTPTEN